MKPVGISGRAPDIPLPRTVPVGTDTGGGTYDPGMNTDAVEAMWAEFSAATRFEGPYTAWAFGDESDPVLATELGELVLHGPKRATTGLLEEFRDEGEAIPEAGDHSVILDGSGEPLCIIRTSSVEVRPFGEVDEGFAWDEGEGDRSLEWWKDAHTRFFTRIGRQVDDDSPVVLERFDLVWPV